MNERDCLLWMIANILTIEQLDALVPGTNGTLKQWLARLLIPQED
jgi:hypothetical protein